MAARKRRIRHDEQTRAKIQATQLINRLQGCVFGEVEMTSTQVSAALALLKKVLPDLKQTELIGDKENPVAITEITRKIIDPRKRLD